VTLTATPYALQGSSHSAQLFREAIASLLGPAGGVLSPGDLAVAQLGAPSMAVQVAAGRLWTPGSSLATINPGGGAYQPQGMYFSENDAPVTLPISAANATNPRVDTIIVQIQDAQYGGSTNSAQLAVLTGTPTAAAALTGSGALAGVGAVPTNSTVLGYVLVPANALSILTADILNTAGTLQTLTQPGQLLGRTLYAPPAEQGFTAALGAVGAAGQVLDPGDLTVACTAPPSGAVIVRLRALAYAAANTSHTWYLVAHGTTAPVGIPTTILFSDSVGGGAFVSPEFLLSGLTPGARYQYDWAATANGTAYVYAGPGGTNAGGAGPAVMEVLAA